MMDSFSYILRLNYFYRLRHLVPCFTTSDIVYTAEMTSNVNKSLSQSIESFDLFLSYNKRESRIFAVNSRQFCLVLLNIIAESSCYG